MLSLLLIKCIFLDNAHIFFYPAIYAIFLLLQNDVTVV